MVLNNFISTDNSMFYVELISVLIYLIIDFEI